VIKLFASFAIRRYQCQNNTVCAVITKRNIKISLVFLEGKLREDKLKNLKSDLQQQQTIFTIATKSNEAAVHAILLFHKLQRNQNHLQTVSM
jgi:hypothetical protein